MTWLLLVVLIGWPVLALIDDLNRRELARSLAAVMAALRDPEQEAFSKPQTARDGKALEPVEVDRSSVGHQTGGEAEHGSLAIGQPSPGGPVGRVR